MGKKKINSEKLEWTTTKATWANGDITQSPDEKCREIAQFFVVNSPCKNISAQSKTLEEYGWEKNAPPKDGFLYRECMKTANLEENVNLFVGTTREDEKQLFMDANMGDDFHNCYRTNRVALCCADNFLQALWRAIRNSMAHCRYSIKKIDGETVYFFENGAASGDKFEVKARMVLTKVTLLKWIETIKNGAKLEKMENERTLAECEDQILKAIKRGEVKKIEDLYNKIGQERKLIDKARKILKDEGRIEYSRAASRWVIAEIELSALSN